MRPLELEFAHGDVEQEHDDDEDGDEDAGIVMAFERAHEIFIDVRSLRDGIPPPVVGERRHKFFARLLVGERRC